MEKKRKVSLLAAMLAVVVGLSQPNPLRFNTGLNTTLTDSLLRYAQEQRWEVSRDSINYVPPVRTNMQHYTAGNSQSAWITYDHNCVIPEPANHGCEPDSLKAKYWYRLTFDLPDSICHKPITDSGAYSLGIRFYADNCVYRVKLNNVSIYKTSFTSPESASDHSSGVLVVMNKYFQQIGNEIVVEVWSEADSDPNNGGWTAFRTKYDATKTTLSSNPCGGPGDDDDGGGPAGDCCLGNKCSDSDNPLTGNYEIPLAGYDFLFSGDGREGQALGKVGVGYNCGEDMPAKLNAFTEGRTSTADAGGQYPESIGIYGTSRYNKTQETAVGVFGEALNIEHDGTSVGVWGTATGAHDNFGGNFFADGGGNRNVGVCAFAMPSTGNPAPHTYLNGSAGHFGQNIGIYAAGEIHNSMPPGNPGIDWAGWFDGDVKVNGSGYININWFSSDRRFKKDIELLENPLEKIQKINGYSYGFRTEEFKERGFDGRAHLGLIAQELKEIYPELVREDAKGYLAVDYQGMTAVLVESVKSQQKQIQELKSAVAGLKEALNSSNGSVVARTLSLSDKNTIVLDQNVPNPFAENTVIAFEVPAGFTKAQLQFRSSEGRLIKVMEITESGRGSVTVFAENLGSGSYTYSLVIDGKVTESKTMIKQ